MLVQMLYTLYLVRILGRRRKIIINYYKLVFNHTGPADWSTAAEPRTPFHWLSSVQLVPLNQLIRYKNEITFFHYPIADNHTFA